MASSFHRVVVIGSGGRLGAAVARQLRQSGHAVVAFDRKALDLSRPEIVDDRLGPLAFDTVVLTAALTGLDDAEHRPEAAYAINAHGPEQVAAIAHRRGARVIHVSTDYVYDGEQPGLRSETDPANPVSVYAMSKFDGENRVLAATDGRALILRTSWVFGPDRPAFPDMLIERARKEARVSAIADKFSSPTSALDAARWIEALLEKPDIRGVLNLCNDGACSWQDYGQKALDSARECGVSLTATLVEPQKLVEMTHFVARRPVHTAISVEKLTGVLGFRPRPWQEALRDYIGRYYGRD